MANDPQPSGFITLREAFQTLAEAWGDGKTDAHLGRIQAAFAEGELRAAVLFPDKPNEFVIPAAIWNAEGFPDRVFLNDDVVESPSPGWEPYRGRTTFVRETAFAKWLGKNSPAPEPDPADFDPLAMPVWTLLMTLAWISTRSIEAVRWQMDDWLEAHGIPPSSIAVAALGLEDEDTDQHPMFFPSSAVMKTLKQVCEASEPAITATALSSETNQPKQLAPSDWHYGAMSFDNELREIWRVGGAQYSRITFDSKRVLETWPSKEAEPLEAATNRESPSEYRRRMMSTAVEKTYPEGVPPTTLRKVGDSELNGALSLLDPKLREPTARDWRRYFNEGSQTPAKAAK